jgi:hypothetical protein
LCSHGRRRVTSSRDTSTRKHQRVPNRRRCKTEYPRPFNALGAGVLFPKTVQSPPPTPSHDCIELDDEGQDHPERGEISTGGTISPLLTLCYTTERFRQPCLSNVSRSHVHTLGSTLHAIPHDHAGTPMDVTKAHEHGNKSPSRELLISLVRRSRRYLFVGCAFCIRASGARGCKFESCRGRSSSLNANRPLSKVRADWVYRYRGGAIKRCARLRMNCRYCSSWRPA